MAYDAPKPAAIIEAIAEHGHGTMLIVDTSTAAGRFALAAAAWGRMFEREVGWSLRLVSHRLQVHRRVQAEERAGTLDRGRYFQSAAHSRQELIVAVRDARRRRDDFLSRRPEPLAVAA